MIISVVLGGITKYYEDGTPYVDGGESGFMDTDELELKTHVKDDEIETTTVTEYWEGDQLRHRSVNMILKKSLGTLIDQAIFGG